MTLEEAIRHAEEVADEHDKIKKIKAVTEYECQCAEEHRQLAKWLKDYKRLLEQKPCGDAISRSEAIRVASGYCHWTNIPAELVKLPSVNPTPCKDAISRQAVVKAVDKHTNEDGTLDNDITCILEEVPSVTPQIDYLHCPYFEEDCLFDEESGDELDMSRCTAKKQPCEDAISRQDALDAFGLSEKTRKYGGDHSGYDAMMLYEIQDVLEGLPSVTPTPKPGRWKEFAHSAYHGVDEYGEPIWRKVNVYHCNKCNRRTVIKEKYCPSCGAKMVEPQESEYNG